MNAQEMWEIYSRQRNIHAEYDAWSFGDDPDILAQLVLSGKKTATASLRLWYDLEGEPLPEAGQYSVILDSQDQAVCIIRSIRVFVCAFCDVDEQQAWREGEGDRSLSYWRSVHERFFREELAQSGLAFNESMSVVCEEFEKVFP